MLRTILWYIYFWIYQVVSLTFFVPLFFLRLLRLTETETSYVRFVTRSWARSMIWAAGGTVTVRGREHVPTDRGYCIVANHQGAFDIPILLGYLPGSVGFLAKKELRYLPVLSTWMKAIHCIFIDRSNRRAAAQAMQQAIETVQSGHPLVIFPEGTRSRSARMGPFKSGSLKLPIRSRALIVPVTIDGSYLMKEANGGLMRPAQVALTIHPPVDTAHGDDKQTRELANLLSRIIDPANLRNR